MEEEYKIHKMLSDERYYIFVSNYGDIFSFKLKKQRMYGFWKN